MKKNFCILIILFGLTDLAKAYEPITLPWYNHPEAGTTFSMSNNPEGIYVLHFYWYPCPPSHYVQKDIMDLAEEYQSENRVAVLDISGDRTDNYYDLWLDKHQQQHPLLADKTHKYFDLWDVRVVSTVIVADANGEEYYRHVGPLDLDDLEELREQVDLLLDR